MWAVSSIITPVSACRARRREVSRLGAVMNRLQTAESSFCQGNRRYVNGKSPRSRKEKPITTFSNRHSSFSRYSGARLRVTSERMSEIPSWCSDFDLRSGFMLRHGGTGRTDVHSASLYSLSSKNIQYIWGKKQKKLGFNV